MERRLYFRFAAAIVVAMIAIALLHSQHNAMVYLLLGVGAFNALVPVRGTSWVRAIAIVATFVGLIWPDTVGALVLLIWLAWAPAFMIAAVLDQHHQASAEPPINTGSPAVDSRVVLVAVIMAIAAASLLYRWLSASHLQQTAALFVGVPALLAIVVVAFVSPRSALGVAFKAVSVGLLVSMLFLNEGMLCVAMSAPLFYAIAALIGTSIDASRRERASKISSGLLMLAMLPMSLEGVTDVTTFNRNESVSESRVVHASPAAIEHALFDTPRFDRVRPAYLRSGFPSPVNTRLERDASGTRWVIQMRGGEMRINGMEPRTGDLVLALEEARPGFVHWRAISDSSHMTHFLNWSDVIVRWDAVDAHTTKVTWTLNYRRGLDPAWYFGPMERYAVHLAAGYLIEAVATP